MTKIYKKVQLSSKWTNLSYYSSIVLMIVLAIISVFLIYQLTYDFKLNVLVVCIFMMLGIGLCYYVMKNIAHGRIEENVIYIKKFGQPEVKYTLNHLDSVKVYETRRDKYIIATMKKGAEIDKYLLINWKVFYSGEVRNTETVLKDILTENKKN